MVFLKLANKSVINHLNTNAKMTLKITSEITLKQREKCAMI